MTPASGPAVEAIKQRKRQHVDLALADASQGAADAGWSDVHLVPAALPEVSFADLDLGTSLSAGACRSCRRDDRGHDDAVDQRRARFGGAAPAAVGGGSQRAALPTRRSSGPTPRRDRAPDAVVIITSGPASSSIRTGRLLTEPTSSTSWR
jgi:hypothetical protein